MKPEHRFWRWTLSLFILVPFIVVGQTIAFMYVNAEDLSQIPPDLQNRLLIFLFVAVLSGMPILIWVLHYLFQIYVLPTKRLIEDAEAILHSTPNARFHITENSDLAAVTHRLNQILKKNEEPHNLLQEQINIASKSLKHPPSLEGTAKQVSSSSHVSVDKNNLKQQHLSEARYVVFDLETTGLEPSRGDEIISIGAVSVLKQTLHKHETFDQLVNPLRPISPASFQIHGVSQKMVEGKPKIEEALQSFFHFIEGSVLVAHNAAFDMKFLKLKEALSGVLFNHPVLDTLLLSAVLHPHQNDHSLDRLCKRYGIVLEKRHDALGDALMTAEVFIRLLSQLETRGITTVEQAFDASQKVPLAQLTY